MSSPRDSTPGRSTTRNRDAEYNTIINFVKTNMKLFLRLIASDIHNTETSLNSNEFNTLKFLFKIYDKKFNGNLSSIAPLFMNFSTTTKQRIDSISDWLIMALSNSIYELDEGVVLRNLSKCVTVKDYQSVNGKNIKITNCDDSYIYINSNVNLVRISNCINCTILIAAVSKIISIDKCENCTITFASSYTRISNCLDTNVNTYSVNEPIIYGDNRGLVLGPHNTYYNELALYLKNSKIIISNSCQNNFKLLISISKEEKQGYEIVKPADFSNLVVPFQSDSSEFLLSPKEYVETYRDRQINMNKIKQMIKESKLYEEQEKALHVAVQGYFREWLVNSGNIKPLTEIVKMIDYNYNNDI
jgi:hypothetical protein